MAKLYLKIKNQTLSISSDIEKIVENSKNYLSLSVDFSSDWDGLVKKYIYISEGKPLEWYEDTVPSAMLKSPGFSLSVIGYQAKDGLYTKRITTEEVFVPIYPSGELNGTLITEEELKADWLEMIENTVTLADTNAKNSVNIANESKNMAQTAETNSETAINTANETAEKLTKEITEVRDNVANAIKGTKSGKTIQIDDVSPIKHNVSLKLSSKNLINPNATLEIIGSYLGIKLSEDIASYNLSIVLKDGATVPSGIYFGFVYFAKNSSSAAATWFVKDGAININSANTAGLANIETLSVAVYPNRQEHWDAIFNAFNVQLEYGKTATDYEQYIDPITVTVTEETTGVTYTPNANGTCEIVSVSPNMILSTDTEGITLKCEYNKDTEKAIKSYVDTVIGGIENGSY